MSSTDYIVSCKNWGKNGYFHSWRSNQANQSFDDKLKYEEVIFLQVTDKLHSYSSEICMFLGLTWQTLHEMLLAPQLDWQTDKITKQRKSCNMLFSSKPIQTCAVQIFLYTSEDNVCHLFLQPPTDDGRWIDQSARSSTWHVEIGEVCVKQFIWASLQECLSIVYSCMRDSRLSDWIITV